MCQRLSVKKWNHGTTRRKHGWILIWSLDEKPFCYDSSKMQLDKEAYKFYYGKVKKSYIKNHEIWNQRKNLEKIPENITQRANPPNTRKLLKNDRKRNSKTLTINGQKTQLAENRMQIVFKIKRYQSLSKRIM